MTESKFPKYLKALSRGKERAPKGSGSQSAPPEATLQPCCQGNVHIAYRGVSDERLYLSKDRSFNEIKYFRPNGLKIFCADCRRRLL